MATPEMDSRCIYCTSAGPFSAEHMIPAGLGADDKRFLLRDMVCKVCNTNVFSTLELEWLRNSPTAIARIFMQEKGRQRGSKRQSPKLGAGQKVVITPEGYTAEADSATEEGRRFFHSLFLQTSDDATWRALTKKDSVHLFRHSGDCSGRRLCVPVGQRQRERAGSKSPRLSGWMMVCCAGSSRSRCVTGFLPVALSHRAGYRGKAWAEQPDLSTRRRAAGIAPPERGVAWARIDVVQESH